MDLTFFYFLKPPLIPHTPFISLHFPDLLNMHRIPHFRYCSCSWRLISDNREQICCRMKLAIQMAGGMTNRMWVLTTSLSCWISLPWTHPFYGLSIIWADKYSGWISATESKTNSGPLKRKFLHGTNSHITVKPNDSHKHSPWRLLPFVS